MKYCYLFFVLIFMGCKKEDPTPTPDPVNTSPSISVTQPADNFTVDLGQGFVIEGLATDQEALASVNYEITTPSASYNYTTSSSIIANSSTNKDFNQTINIPMNASVGAGILSVYATDSKGIKSTTITRNFKILDKIAPTITKIEDSVGVSDLIVINVFRNSNNVVDSVQIFNQTRSETIGMFKEIGGFKTMVCSILQAGINPTNTQFYDLIPSSQTSYTYQINGAGQPFGSLVSIGFREYDNTQDNSVPYVDYLITFKY